MIRSRSTEYRSSLEVKVAFCTYKGMNSHICNSSPSFNVAIDWRRKGIDRQPEIKQNGHAPLEHYYQTSLLPLTAGERELSDAGSKTK